MTRRRRALITIATMLISGVASAQPRRPADDSPAFDPAQVYRVPRGAAPTEGPDTAAVTIVVWSDFACGFCVRAQHTLDQLRRLYPGQLRFVHRTLPLDDDNTIAAQAALAASAQGRFAPMKDRLYAIAGRIDRPGVELLARELGLDLVRFRADLDSGVHRAAIAADVADARQLGVTGTPMFFINGRSVNGNQTLRVFAAVVDEELERVASAPMDYEGLVVRGRPTADAPHGTSNPSENLDPKQSYRVGLGLAGHQLGPVDAPVTIVLWSDFQCPYCARMATSMTHVRQKYGDRVRIVFRHFPVQGHRNASLAAEAAVAAADQGKFWAFHDQIFGNAGKLTRTDLETFAKTAGLDLAKFRAALDDRRYRDTVIAEAATATALGVDGTPTMFVNGFPLIGTKRDDVLDAEIDGRIEQATRAIRAGLPAGDVYALVMTAAKGNERADPTTIPVPSAVHLELRADERVRGATAACRRHDGARAKQLVVGLVGDARRRVVDVCATAGVDL